MPDSTEINMLVGFELLLLIGTIYFVARRRILLGAGRRPGLPMSLPALLLALTVLVGVMVLIGGVFSSIRSGPL